MKTYVPKSRNYKIYAFAIALCLTIASFFGSAKGNFSIANVVDPFLGNYYFSDYASKTESKDAANRLCEEIMEEGVVLLKNEDNALPLAPNSKISIFGKNSEKINYDASPAGSSSSASSSGRRILLHEALRDAGFSINPNLRNFYLNDSQSGSGYGTPPGNGNISSGYNTGETPIANYSAVPGLEDSYQEYNDVALIVIMRSGGEGWDLPKTMTYDGASDYKGWNTNAVVPGARSGTDHYLQLDVNEAALMKYVGERFDKVIVLLNTSAPIECGFLDDPNHYGYHPNLKAALFIGLPGARGLSAIGKILKGEVNPSGRTANTYARDFKQDPTWMNHGNNRIRNGNMYTNVSGGNFFSYFVNYQEGIYVGYRYWETRGFVEGNTAWVWQDAYYNSTAIYPSQGTAINVTYDNWYKGHVVYPFGYGLSYTTFTKEIVAKSPSTTELGKNDTIKLTVKVTNTGDYPGKDVVQLYYTAPYYQGGIEKSHVVLGAFEKTSLLMPGASETVTLTLDVQDMASYDYSDANNNDFKGYELDAGQYQIKIMNNAHDVVDYVTYTIPEGGYQYRYDKATNNEVVNRFDDVSYGGGQEPLRYMSRADFAGTFPITPTDNALIARADVVSKIAEWGNSTMVPDKPSDPWYTAVAPATNLNRGSIKLSAMVGRDIDDPAWGPFLDQWIVSDMNEFVMLGGWRNIEIPVLGVPYGRYEDGPNGLKGNNGSTNQSCAVYPSEMVLACSWNKELCRRKGIMFGNEGLFGNNNNQTLSGVYAPAINIHRSPFSGRNFEYYSEDGYLTGALAAQVVAGAKEKGFLCFIKHFALNDQETNRAGVSTWASEQSMREIYLKPFELCVKDGGTTAIMSSFNRIGAVWAGGRYELLTEVLRNEWGFKGMVLTDYINSRLALCNPDQTIRAGGDIMLHSTERRINNTSSPTVIALLRRATHNICYAIANSTVMNTGDPAAKDAIDFSASQLTIATRGEPYNQSIATATFKPGQDVPTDNTLIKYYLKPGSELPAGLSLSENGIITGTPTEMVNNHKFIVQAKYGVLKKEAEFTLSVVVDGSIVFETGEPLPTAFVGQLYNHSIDTAYIFKTSGEQQNDTNIVYRLKNGSCLPEGMSLTSEGMLTGTPAKICRNYSFTVIASAAGYEPAEATFNLTVKNNNNQKSGFSNGTLKIGKFGVPYLDQIKPLITIDGMPVTYSLAEGSSLPQGLVLTPGGYITGIPRETVSEHVFTVVAISAYSEPVTAEYKITIGLAFIDFELPYGVVGEEYDSTVDMAQGAIGISYVLSSESKLPPGLKLNSDGSLVGTPTRAGVYVLKVIANKPGILEDSITLVLFIGLE